MDYETGLIIATILLGVSEIIPYVPWIPGGGIIQSILRAVSSLIKEKCKEEKKPNEP